MTTLAITFKDDHQKFIEEAMKSGRYVSESELVADAIAELKAREQLRDARIADLRTEVNVGLEQLDRGEAREWDVAAIKAEGREGFAARRSQT